MACDEDRNDSLPAHYGKDHRLARVRSAEELDEPRWKFDVSELNGTSAGVPEAPRDGVVLADWQTQAFGGAREGLKIGCVPE